jgi:phosphoglycerate dehydrogenase-like enzyme
MKLGIPGTGHVATTLAGGWSAKHEVTLGSCDPVGKDAGQPVLSLADVVTGADVVVNAVPGGAGTAGGPEHYLVLFAKLAGMLKTEAFNIRVVY